MRAYRWDNQDVSNVWNEHFIGKEVFLEYWNNLALDNFRLTEMENGYYIFSIKDDFQERMWRLVIVRPYNGNIGLSMQLRTGEDIEDEFINLIDESFLISVCEKFFEKMVSKQLEPSLVWNLL